MVTIGFDLTYHCVQRAVVLTKAVSHNVKFIYTFRFVEPYFQGSYIPFDFVPTTIGFNTDGTIMSIAVNQCCDLLDAYVRLAIFALTRCNSHHCPSYHKSKYG